jgi:hypothetical protein
MTFSQQYRDNTHLAVYCAGLIRQAAVDWY